MVRQVAWISLLPQLAVMGLLVLGYYVLDSSAPLLYGLLSYLVLSFLLKMSIARFHRRGIQLVKGGAWAEAIDLFEKSYAFFSRNRWVDAYRFLTLLDSSKISYREMALCNIGFCYGQMGDRKAAMAAYGKAVEEFPESALAMAALHMLQSMDAASSLH